MFNNMGIRARMRVLLGCMLMGLVLISGLGLLSLRSSLVSARQSQVQHMVQSAISIMKYYHDQETAGKLTREQAIHAAGMAIQSATYNDGKDYFFVFDYNNVERFISNPKLLNKDMSNVADADGVLFVPEMVKAARKGGGFVSYSFPRPGSTDPKPKISYAQAFDDWQLVVGTGVYVDDITTAFWEETAKQLVYIVIVLVLLGVVASVLVRSVLKQLGGEPAYASEVVRRIAAGDLSVAVRTESRDEGSLLAGIQRMANSLRDLIRQIHDNAGEAGQLTQEVANAANKVASGSDSQSDATRSMAAAIEEMTTSISVVADSAGEASRLSGEAGEQAREGSRIIEGTSNKINHISGIVADSAASIGALGEQTDSIASIMQMIREVADQTNLLALNAAIEAARAGEAGRGFAVVADEVRKLAERTSSATAEISGKIDAIRSASQDATVRMGSVVTEVAHGVEMAGVASTAIASIRDDAGRVVTSANQISEALREQSSASHAIASHVEDIANMAEQNSSNARRVADASQRLDQIMRGLKDSVGQFRV
ncbi:methyl-accepting chemotaxis protein [Silvimonas amylolytica]|uniref:Methyl-accepting chemotaxis protein 4 n=1 Tax=Silvimonas amylolytica TaxID=449663 RepID=A0ABQ2PQC1_9NEIS|nr:methyl-accepting chemotaxis protein [Silvimonas amylolytica]GGP27187.1 methyl-accepting chemotaxis protein 4 [Silvimonas amylolytica]